MDTGLTPKRRVPALVLRPGMLFTGSVIERALLALAERGQWVSPPDVVPELLRLELRHAARRAQLRLRTGIDARGRVWATTPDGLPAHEPWRGAAAYALESGAEEAAALNALERLLRRSSGGHRSEIE